MHKHCRGLSLIRRSKSCPECHTILWVVRLWSQGTAYPICKVDQTPFCPAWIWAQGCHPLIRECPVIHWWWPRLPRALSTGQLLNATFLQPGKWHGDRYMWIYPFFYSNNCISNRPTGIILLLWQVLMEPRYRGGVLASMYHFDRIKVDQTQWKGSEYIFSL